MLVSRNTLQQQPATHCSALLCLWQWSSPCATHQTPCSEVWRCPARAWAPHLRVTYERASCLRAYSTTQRALDVLYELSLVHMRGIDLRFRQVWVVAEWSSCAPKSLYTSLCHTKRTAPANQLSCMIPCTQGGVPQRKNHGG